MLFIPIITVLLLIVSILQTLLYPKEQNKLQHTHTPTYNYGAENPYFQRPLPYNYPPLTSQKAPSEEEVLLHKKNHFTQSVFYTFLFVLGLMAFLLYN
jgi:hypothetical protein